MSPSWRSTSPILLMIPLTLALFARGDYGRPAVTPFLTLGALTSYTHTITATCGFESMQCTFAGTLDDALFWFTHLMAGCVVSGPDAETVWEGYLCKVEARLGQETRSLSLDAMSNQVWTRYTDLLGTAITGTPAGAPLVQAASQQRYGVKETVLSLSQSTAAAAVAAATATLQARAWPLATSNTTVQSGALGDISITLTFAGWYDTLGWVTTVRNDTTSEQTTDQIKTLLGGVAPGIGAINAFLGEENVYVGTDGKGFIHIVDSGITDTRKIESRTTYRDKIEALLKLGHVSGERFAWGVYEDRQFWVQLWAGATPQLTTYRRYLGDGQIYKSGECVVPPWSVRPNAMYETPDLIDPAADAATIDSVARFFVERVTCTINGDQAGVTLEPAATTSLDAILAVLAKGH